MGTESEFFCLFSIEKEDGQGEGKEGGGGVYFISYSASLHFQFWSRSINSSAPSLSHTSQVDERGGGRAAVRRRGLNRFGGVVVCARRA